MLLLCDDSVKSVSSSHRVLCRQDRWFESEFSKDREREREREPLPVNLVPSITSRESLIGFSFFNVLLSL